MSHAYKGKNELKFKCDECEFLGPNTLTMEVHVKKAHCLNIKYGLCDYEADGVESLEIHISTCETYGCFQCDTIFKTLADIKEHLSNEQWP